LLGRQPSLLELVVVALLGRFYKIRSVDCPERFIG